MAFVLCGFHLVVMCFMLIRGKMARNVNEGAFFIKILLIIGAFIGVMYISNDFFMGTFIDICRYVSIVFLAF
jgi:hypothetical protein